MQVKLLVPQARLPHKAHAGDLGYDLFAAEGVTLAPGYTKLVSTGIAIQFPAGYGGIIKDRSSMATKRHLFTVAGVIDNGYIGEVSVALYNGNSMMAHIAPGEKIAQLVLIPTVDFAVEEVDILIAPDGRGVGGFGSTGV